MKRVIIICASLVAGAAASSGMTQDSKITAVTVYGDRALVRREMKLDAVSPEPSTIAEREKPGSLAWRIELKPDEKKTVEFAFSVSYPKGRELTGIE
ncbi:MAG: hypothetical protein NT045_03405 [Candidatus Aureabacteria bacterium]|nr:hypothetical protein [Candidatus Auribacterota bacterium]